MSREWSDAIVIVIVALMGGFGSELFNSALDTPELWNFVKLAIITTLLLMGVIVLLYIIKKGREIEESTMIVAGVLIGAFVSKYLEITSDIHTLSIVGLLVLLCVFMYLLIIVYSLLRWINSEWVSNTLKRLSSSRK